jgi:hypothetical protein
VTGSEILGGARRVPDPRVPRCGPHQGGEVLQPPHRLRLPLRPAECGVHQPTSGQAQGQDPDPGSGAFFNPGSEIQNRFLSGSRNPDHGPKPLFLRA